MEPTDWPAFYSWRKGRHEFPDRCFLLTFDDGLADHVNVVLPILEERNLRAVFFVPGAVLATERLLSAHAIHLLLATLGEERFRNELLAFLADHGDETDYAATLDADAAQRMYHYETPSRAHLKYMLTAVLPIERRRAAVRALFEEHIGSMTRWSRNWYLRWQDVVRLEHAGHTVGGHGYSHEPYHRLTANETRQDVYRTAAVLRSGLGNDLRPFSYPYGSYDDAVAEACHAAGFAQAFTTRRGWITRQTDPYQLPRVDTIHVDAVLEEEFTCVQV
jgi:peptidoglycan/xylan/chitin deacetylase (PgdA/CDA1 family)